MRPTLGTKGKSEMESGATEQHNMMIMVQHDECIIGFS